MPSGFPSDLVNVKVTGSPGTGTFTLGAANTGFKDATGIPDGTPVSYAASDGANSEASRGVVSGSGTSLTRNATGQIDSTNGDALVSFGAGVSVVITALRWDLIEISAGEEGAI